MPSERMDAEVIAEFMEPSPVRQRGRGRDSLGGWWRWCGTPPKWVANHFGNRLASLDALRLVEARLTEDQVCTYEARINQVTKIEGHSTTGNGSAIFPWHASAEQKVRLLAAVIRGAR